MTEATVGMRQVLDIVAALEDLGIARHVLLSSLGMDMTAAAEDVRIPAARVVALFDEAERRTGNALVGLHAGERAQPRGALVYLVLSNARLDEGIRRTAPFIGIAISTARIVVETSQDAFSVVYKLGDDALAAQRHVIEYVLMMILRTLQRASGQTVPAREVHLRHPDVGLGVEMARAFACPVHFGRPEDRLVFRTRDLEVESTTANPLVAAQIERFMSSLLARTTAPAPLRMRVQEYVRSFLARGIRADEAVIARQLGMSDRTLQRGLESEGATFRELRDGIVWEVVEALLSNPSLKVEAVALGAGFSDLPAFVKSFRRWAGCTPSEYRRRIAKVIG